MTELKLFIWEGNGISEAYHDDGTLVVLAHDVAEARNIVRKGKVSREAAEKEWHAKRDAAIPTYGSSDAFWQSDEGRALWNEHPGFDSSWWDGKDEGLDREPTRILTVDQPKWVAFNGGGYD